MNLTPKQRRFVGEYLKDLNGTQAAIRAGYQSKARRTREAYASDWSMFTRWCEQHGESPLPASVQRIVAYLSYMASEGGKTTTMTRYLLSISLAHKAAGFDDPPVAITPVREAMKGFRRMISVKRDKKTPLRRDDFARIFRTVDNSMHPSAERDRDLLLVGFAGAFRRSEFVALCVEDLESVPEGDRDRASLEVRSGRRRHEESHPSRQEALPCPCARSIGSHWPGITNGGYSGAFTGAV